MLTPNSAPNQYLFPAAALLTAALMGCGGADTSPSTVETGGVTAVPSGTNAGDSARAAAPTMADTTRRDTGTAPGTATP